jgi:hypothetical protein
VLALIFAAGAAITGATRYAAAWQLFGRDQVTFSIHIGPNIRTSPYFEATVADGVRSFSVYNHMAIPGHFGDPDAEYDRLLNGVAMWDVAAQRQVQLDGARRDGAGAASDAAQPRPGQRSGRAATCRCATMTDG